MSRGVGVPLPQIEVNGEWQSLIHPAYAMMLSFFSEPILLDDACKKIARFFGADFKDVLAFCNKLIKSEEPTHANLGGFESGFPIHLIIEEEKACFPVRRYRPADFSFDELDFKSKRMLRCPATIVLMPNNTCYTDCLYCYADTKTRKNILSFSDIERMVENAHKSNVKDILITGGDFFMYRHWREMLSVLKRNEYVPDLISTKKPVSPDEIDTFADFNIRLQISLDTADNKTAQTLLNVKDGYADKMKESIRYIDRRNICYQVATVLTNINDNTENLDTLLSFLNTLKHLKRWEIRVAFRSLYSKLDFDNIKSSRKAITRVEQWIETHRKDVSFEMLWSPDDDHKYKKSTGGSDNFEGARCSANRSNMVILPNGDVTVCEQLYWTPHFIIGNIKEHSLEEIWNSQKALSLVNVQQKDIATKSPCHTCSDFIACAKASNRCYADIMKAYGFDRYEFPDPRCAKAPAFKTDITHE